MGENSNYPTNTIHNTMKKKSFAKLARCITTSIFFATTGAIFGVKATPTNFSSKLSGLTSGQTLVLAAGNYNLSGTDIASLEGKTNVTLIGVKGETKIYPPANDMITKVEFKNKSNLTFQKIIFKHISLRFTNCSDLVIDDCTFENNGEPNPEIVNLHGVSQVVLVFGGDDIRIKRTLAKSFHDSYSIMGFQINGADDVIVRDCFFRKKLNNAIIMQNGDDLKSYRNHAVREAGGPESSTLYENHGYYLHSGTDFQHYSNYCKGFSNTPTGYSLKIKGVNRFEAWDNDYYTSGIVGRAEDRDLQNVYIYDNHVHHGDINIWLKEDWVPERIRISRNQIDSGNIVATRNITKRFNWSVTRPNGRGGISGGVVDNTALDGVLSGLIRQARNSWNGNN